MKSRAKPDLPPAQETPTKRKKAESGFYEPYSQYHRTVRVWMLAYGLGAPLFLTRLPSKLKALHDHGSLHTLLLLFLIGVCAQVLLALLYKIAMWYLYMWEIDELPETDWRVRASEWLSTAFWIELVVDLGTLGLFARGTWMIWTTIS